MDAVEAVVSMPIVNPETRGVSRTFRFMGKVDRVEGRKVIDYKGIDNLDRFIRKMRIGYQAELYALGVAVIYGVAIDEIEYRCVARPTRKYKHPTRTWAVTKPSRKTAIKVCDTEDEACKLAVARDGEVQPRVTGNPDREHYERECLDWLLEDTQRVATYLYRVTSSKLVQARWFLWENSKRLLENRRCNRWIPNCGACFAYSRDCEYIALCDALQNGADYEWIIEDQYRIVESSHAELDGADDDGKDVLTYTSLSCLTLCEMRYYWRHERRLRKGVEDDGEALLLGSAMHRGLEVYAMGGAGAAFAAIEEWQEQHPVLGDDAAWKQDERIARARAMVLAATRKWDVALPATIEPERKTP